MIDQTTLAYVNLYAVLGALADLTSLDPRAQALLKGKKPTRLGIAVKGGPAATLVFEEQRCRLEEGVGQCHIKLAFSSPQRFNGMIAGTVTPIRPGRSWSLRVAGWLISFSTARSTRWPASEALRFGCGA